MDAASEASQEGQLVAQQQVFKDEVLARADQRYAGEEEAEHLKHRLSIADSSPHEVLPSDTAVGLLRAE